MNYSRLRELHEQVGEVQFTKHVFKLIADDKLNVGNFSLHALWEAMGQPDLNAGIRLLGRGFNEKELFEALDSTAFPKITGQMINKVVQDAYTLASGVGMELVTVIPSATKDDTLVGYTALDGVEEVEEGMPYEEGGLGEKYHMVRNRKFGRILGLTEEMVKFDQTNQLIQRAQRIGEKAAAKKEEIILRVVMGVTNTGVYASWRPGGTATTLYSNTSTDPYTTATVDNLITDTLADETDIDAAMTELGDMKDENGDYIAINPKELLVGWPLSSVADKIIGSGGTLVATYSNVINPWQGKLIKKVSPWVAALKGAAYWFVGDFKKQFVWTEVFPLQTFQEKPGSPSEFERDVKFRFKSRYMGGCGAISNRFVIRSTGAG